MPQPQQPSAHPSHDSSPPPAPSAELLLALNAANVAQHLGDLAEQVAAVAHHFGWDGSAGTAVSLTRTARRLHEDILAYTLERFGAGLEDAEPPSESSARIWVPGGSL